MCPCQKNRSGQSWCIQINGLETALRTQFVNALVPLEFSLLPVLLPSVAGVNQRSVYFCICGFQRASNFSKLTTEMLDYSKLPIEFITALLNTLQQLGHGFHIVNCTSVNATSEGRTLKMQQVWTLSTKE